MKLKTKIIHNKSLYNTYMPPITNSSTILQKNIQNIKNNRKKNISTYGIHGNIITKQLIDKLNIIENGKYTILSPSGLMSIFLAIFPLINKNDIILIPNSVYTPTINIIKTIKKKTKIKAIIYNPGWSKSKLEKKFKKFKNIKIIYMEIPSSINLKTNNITKLTKLSKKKKSISVIDNTYSSGIGFKPLNNKITISIQALTKYQSGNNDLLMGSLTTNKKKFYKKILKTYKNIGVNINNYDCYLILRNLNTLPIKYKLQEINSTIIAKWLKKKNIFKKITHPNLINKKDKKKFYGFNGLISAEFKKTIKKKNIYKFINNLKLFKIGYSWGGAISLIMLYKIKKKYIVRFSIGLESKSDLIKDIKNKIKLLNK